MIIINTKPTIVDKYTILNLFNPCNAEEVIIYIFKNNPVNTGLHDNLETMAHSDIMNANEMHDKSFAMLQERLNNGLITVEEFNKKCNELNKNN